MDDMDIDSVLEIPDPPDRLSTRRMNRGNHGENGCNLSVAGHLGGYNAAGEESMGCLRGNNRLVSENGHNRKHHLHPRRQSCSVDEIEHHKNTIFISPLGKDQQNAPLFSKAVTERSRNSTRVQDMDKGKAPSFMLPSKSCVSRKNHTILDLTEQNMPQKMVAMASQRGGLQILLPEGRRDGQLPRNGGSYLGNATKSSAESRISKGKGKLDDIGFKTICAALNHGKEVGLSHGSPLRMDNQLTASPRSVFSPRATGQKRLVRNGCISPQNIAIRPKQFNEQSKANSKVEKNSENLVSNAPSRIGISEIIAEDKHNVKGKCAVHSHASTKQETNFIDLCSGPMSNDDGVASVIGDSIRDTGFEEQSGWRSTHNRPKNIEYLARHCFSRFNNRCQEQDKERFVIRCSNSGENSRIGHECPENPDATETAPVPIIEPSHATDLVPKRQKKRVLTSRRSGRSSSSVSNIQFHGSSGESSSSMSTSTRIGQHLDVLNLDKSLDMRGTNANSMKCVNDQDSVARARQVEADERLACELQEQLYHEMPIFGNAEMDEEIAWALQEEDDTVRPASVQNCEPTHRGSIRNSHFQTSSWTSQNSSNRRVQARLSTSARMSRLRSQVINQPSIARPRARNSQFPLGIDLDMRLDILEAMEAALEGADAIGMDSHIFQFQRDFNENDYEILLALDENNHRHGGASTNQINSLPLSKVQSDNYDEACAICLDTPTAGETIRHLPCLHKFHKDCIDPWLSRKTSCPVCKSSIT